MTAGITIYIGWNCKRLSLVALLLVFRRSTEQAGIYR
jgi:hypothetical protein